MGNIPRLTAPPDMKHVFSLIFIDGKILDVPTRLFRIKNFCNIMYAVIDSQNAKTTYVNDYKVLAMYARGMSQRDIRATYFWA